MKLLQPNGISFQTLLDDTYLHSLWLVNDYGETIDYAEWKWAESTIPLYTVPYSDMTHVPIDPSEFPLS
jgi:hypothetical protein